MTHSLGYTSRSSAQTAPPGLLICICTAVTSAGYMRGRGGSTGRRSVAEALKIPKKEERQASLYTIPCSHGTTCLHSMPKKTSVGPSSRIPSPSESRRMDLVCILSHILEWLDHPCSHEKDTTAQSLLVGIWLPRGWSGSLLLLSCLYSRHRPQGSSSRHGYIRSKIDGGRTPSWTMGLGIGLYI